MAAPAQLGIWDVFLRMLCAMVVGSVIGAEREYIKRPAGLRTHILVSLGACAVMLTGEMIFSQYYAYGALPDPARLPAQVITGVGFLGAGTILREGSNVRGLTTAASLWTVACLGVAAGAGHFAVSLVGMLFVLTTLILFEFLQSCISRSDFGLVGYQLKTQDVAQALDALMLHSKQQNADIRNIRVHHIRTEPA